ncbi:MAG: GntR family transcriptional regulator, partial [Eubacteriales bacterium]
ENENSNLSQTVYDYIMQMLIKQEIKCGERISEENISERLNISRTPIREALRLLASQGLVIIYPKRFAEVVTFTETDRHQIGIVRLNQDVFSAKLAIQNGSNADFLNMSRVADECEKYAKLDDMYLRITTDCRFHLMLAEIGKNQVHTAFQQILYQKICLMQAANYVGAEDSLQKISHHRQIIDGLVQRDAGKTIHAIVEHLKKFYRLEESEYAFMLSYFENEAKRG